MKYCFVFWGLEGKGGRNFKRYIIYCKNCCLPFLPWTWLLVCDCWNVWFFCWTYTHLYVFKIILIINVNYLFDAKIFHSCVYSILYTLCYILKFSFWVWIKKFKLNSVDKIIFSIQTNLVNLNMNILTPVCTAHILGLPLLFIGYAQDKKFWNPKS